MPMTCTSTKSQNIDIEKIVSPINDGYLEMCIYESLVFLENEFFGDKQCQAIQLLRDYVSRAVHAHKVCIFFLLLNIDRNLKEKLMHLDQSHAKMARFFMDLRQELVTTFFCSSQPVLDFVVQCQQTYRIA
jgi:hypothetical protein